MKESDWQAEIVTVGREILVGRTLDTNAHWLCRRLARLGGQVRRVAVVDDDPKAVSRELRRSLRSGTEVVITTGGLGPTDDDRTLQGVAHALRREMALHPQAERWLRAFYQRLYRAKKVRTAEFSPAREKMAALPRGATPLRNPCGAAPGVMLREGRSLLFCLPGVPREMRGIFLGSVQALLKRVMTARHFRERELPTGLKDETEVAALLRSVQDQFPDLYFKSLPKGFGRSAAIKVRLSLRGRDPGRVERRLKEAAAGLKKALRERNR